MSEPTNIHNQDAASNVVNAAIDAAGITRRDALKLMLATAGATLLTRPIMAHAEEGVSAETSAKLSAAQSQLDDAQAELAKIANEYQALAEEQSRTIQQIEDVQAQIVETQEQIDKKQADLDKKRDILSKRISSYYKSGDPGMLSLLLSSTSFDDFITNVYYMGKINESEQSMIEAIRKAKEELDAKKAELENQKASLEELSAQQAQQLTDMQAQQTKAQEVINGLSEDVKTLMAQRDAEIAAAAAEAAAAEAARKARAAAAASAAAGSPAAGASSISTDGGNGSLSAVISACSRTASPGVGWCAAWVSNVFSNAGVGSFGGNACDMYSWWCGSSDRSALKPGMIVAVSSSSSGTTAGLIYGHVGIYVGGGTVMHNIGGIASWPIDQWISQYGQYVTTRWGWLGGVVLS